MGFASVRAHVVTMIGEIITFAARMGIIVAAVFIFASMSMQVNPRRGITMRCIRLGVVFE